MRATKNRERRMTDKFLRDDHANILAGKNFITMEVRWALNKEAWNVIEQQRRKRISASVVFYIGVNE